MNKKINFKKNNSKYDILKSVKDLVSIFYVPELIQVNALNIKKNNFNIDGLFNNFNTSLLAIRSSASDEDDKFISLAGEYDSVLNVPSDNYQKIISSVKKVVSSYEKKRSLLPDDKVIIQEMVSNVSMSGVIFTHDLNTGAPYYVINYDDKSGLTDTVTSGDGEYSNRTLFIHRNSTSKLQSDRFIKLIKAVKELEQIMQSHFLDIEFALGQDMKVFLLQVRAITTQPNWNKLANNKIDEVLKDADSFVKGRFKRIRNVYGKTTILGQMPDWNPVEMIGRAPRALSLSLYKTLITDNAWSIAREYMGYHIPKGKPLLVDIAGQPFIDTRLSFHSFLPCTLSSKISEKVVNHWIEHLRASPELHDKVEFDIAITAYSFDIDNRIKELIGDSLNETEKKDFKKAHLDQTRRLLKGEDKASIKNALSLIEILSDKHLKYARSKEPSDLSLLPVMISECIQYGTIPFSILARHGFIAKTFLLSLESIGLITSEEMSFFEESIQTVASNLVDDMQAFQIGEIENDEFMKRYGHLRPGTYDIMSKRYDQMTNLNKGNVVPKLKNKSKIFKFSKKQQQKINDLLIENGFEDFKADSLLNYLKEAIIGREYSKFVFTRSVSEILELIANFAERNGLNRDQISHVPINSILKISKSRKKSVKSSLISISELEELNHQVSIAIRLPQVLTNQSGAYIVPFQVAHPNFITNKNIIANCLFLNSTINKISLKGKIILIEGADPGYDWIFSQQIAGLITKYGGVNSHMAIRCAEFGIPAAIGCGEQRFEALIRSNKVGLDCASGLINILH